MGIWLLQVRLLACWRAHNYVEYMTRCRGHRPRTHAIKVVRWSDRKDHPSLVAMATEGNRSKNTERKIHDVYSSKRVDSWIWTRVVLVRISDWMTRGLGSVGLGRIIDKMYCWSQLHADDVLSRVEWVERNHEKSPKTRRFSANCMLVMAWFELQLFMSVIWINRV